uniref:Deubiquitinating enzyme MINDY-3/4 conserved domain-containing protein n=1 Tax=Globisporangium ultimum (strain ATCC 200006 / CBS 805.95 / DAOM BR144) TaxID=431595 RepID=K3WCB1_GLOUD
MVQVLSATERRELLRLMWPQHVDDVAPHPDTQRWYQQGFEFQTAASAFPLGLVQGHGGPCGVLAAVQAEILRLFLFEYQNANARHDNTPVTPLPELLAQVADAGETAQNALLTEAIASVLIRCGSRHRSGPYAVHIVVLASTTTREEDLVYEEIVVQVASPREPELLRVIHERLQAFQSPHGVMNFMFSALRTKGVEQLLADMDDLEAALTGQFGHCSQELLNFLLTGAAVSNVFDGNVPMGDSGLLLHGIPERARVGYLTHLEAMRYCQVGSYYKSPIYPVWVIGSTSHFSVTFALDPAVCEESTSQMLFQRVQRVFKSFDSMETGFMDIAVLTESLKQLGVSDEVVSNDYWMARLLGRLEVAGAGIILWDEYWKVVSVLLHTNDLELALSGNYQAANASRGGNDSNGSGSQRPRSDSDIARELQAQFDAEDRGGQPDVSIMASPAPTVVPSQDEFVPTSQEFELYYYNGLGSQSAGTGSTSSGNGGRQPQLSKCSITIPTNVDFIGKSVPIFETGTSGGYGCPPLEEVIKTKWTSARINWFGQPVPSID